MLLFTLCEERNKRNSLYFSCFSFVIQILLIDLYRSSFPRFHFNHTSYIFPWYIIIVLSASGLPHSQNDQFHQYSGCDRYNRFILVKRIVSHCPIYCNYLVEYIVTWSVGFSRNWLLYSGMVNSFSCYCILLEEMLDVFDLTFPGRRCISLFTWLRSMLVQWSFLKICRSFAIDWASDLIDSCQMHFRLY